MTLTILLISLIHTIPVFFSTAYWNTKLSVTFSSILMCIIAFVTGNAQYILFDLIAISIAYYLCIKGVENSRYIKQSVPQKELQSQKAELKSDDSIGSIAIIIIIITIGLIFYFKITKSNNTLSTSMVQIKENNNIIQDNLPNKPLQNSKAVKNSRIKKKSHLDIRHCLDLNNDLEIMQCANH